MYKLIALDMDGTLLNPQGQITPRTHAAITAARAKGVTVVLASGRPLEGMSRYLVELGLTGEHDYVICYNG
ncbi:MAG: HAD-IIB family hydrolase, partial [Aeromonas jandaei]